MRLHPSTMKPCGYIQSPSFLSYKSATKNPPFPIDWKNKIKERKELHHFLQKNWTGKMLWIGTKYTCRFFRLRILWPYGHCYPDIIPNSQIKLSLRVLSSVILGAIFCVIHVETVRSCTCESVGSWVPCKVEQLCGEIICSSICINGRAFTSCKDIYIRDGYQRLWKWKKKNVIIIIKISSKQWQMYCSWTKSAENHVHPC